MGNVISESSKESVKDGRNIIMANELQIFEESISFNILKTGVLIVKQPFF